MPHAWLRPQSADPPHGGNQLLQSDYYRNYVHLSDSWRIFVLLHTTARETISVVLCWAFLYQHLFGVNLPDVHILHQRKMVAVQVCSPGFFSISIAILLILVEVLLPSEIHVTVGKSSSTLSNLLFYLLTERGLK